MPVKLLSKWECIKDITYYYSEENCSKLAFIKGKTYVCRKSINTMVYLDNELGTTTGFNRRTFPGDKFRMKY